MGRIVNQVFSGITAAPGQPPGSSHSVFDGLRGLGLEPRDFTSCFHQPFSGFPEQAAFVILFHSRSLLDFVASLPPHHGSLRESLYFHLSVLEFMFDRSPIVFKSSPRNHTAGLQFEIGEQMSGTKISSPADGDH
jgi:3-hydroxy-3-methylglutaryl CoA synthase